MSEEVERLTQLVEGRRNHSNEFIRDTAKAALARIEDLEAEIDQLQENHNLLMDITDDWKQRAEELEETNRCKSQDSTCTYSGSGYCRYHAVLSAVKRAEALEEEQGVLKQRYENTRQSYYMMTEERNKEFSRAEAAEAKLAAWEALFSKGGSARGSD